jgi:hypothetical protein
LSLSLSWRRCAACARWVLRTFATVVCLLTTCFDLCLCSEASAPVALFLWLWQRLAWCLAGFGGPCWPWPSLGLGCFLALTFDRPCFICYARTQQSTATSHFARAHHMRSALHAQHHSPMHQTPTARARAKRSRKSPRPIDHKILAVGVGGLGLGAPTPPTPAALHPVPTPTPHTTHLPDSKV